MFPFRGGATPRTTHTQRDCCRTPRGSEDENWHSETKPFITTPENEKNLTSLVLSLRILSVARRLAGASEIDTRIPLCSAPCRILFYTSAATYVVCAHPQHPIRLPMTRPQVPDLWFDNIYNDSYESKQARLISVHTTRGEGGKMARGTARRVEPLRAGPRHSRLAAPNTVLVPPTCNAVPTGLPRTARGQKTAADPHPLAFTSGVDHTPDKAMERHTIYLDAAKSQSPTE